MPDNVFVWEDGRGCKNQDTCLSTFMSVYFGAPWASFCVEFGALTEANKKTQEELCSTSYKKHRKLQNLPHSNHPWERSSTVGPRVEGPSMKGWVCRSESNTPWAVGLTNSYVLVLVSNAQGA